MTKAFFVLLALVAGIIAWDRFGHKQSPVVVEQPLTQEPVAPDQHQPEPVALTETNNLQAPPVVAPVTATNPVAEVKKRTITFAIEPILGK